MLFRLAPTFRPHLTVHWNWHDLDDVGKAAVRFFLRDRLPPPIIGESGQARAQKFTALLAARPWPAALQRFVEVYGPALEELVYEAMTNFELSSPIQNECWHLSVAADIARYLPLLPIRNAELWFARWVANGGHEDQEWKAMILGPRGRTLRTIVNRQLKLAARRKQPRPRDGQDYLATVADEPFDWNTSPAWLDALPWLDSALERLSPIQQRVLRLHYGLFPAVEPWSPNKTSKYLALSGDRISLEVSQALAALRLDFANARVA